MAIIKMINAALFSSKTDEWETPIDLFKKLDERYHFETDVCATDLNSKCQNHYTREQDGLAQEWSGRCWMNPPYGRAIGAWVKKAFDSVKLGRAEIVVCLLPSRTDTRWFHDYCVKGSVEFIRGRLKFGCSKNSAPFPSMIVVFDKSKFLKDVKDGRRI